MSQSVNVLENKCEKSVLWYYKFCFLRSIPLTPLQVLNKYMQSLNSFKRNAIISLEFRKEGKRKEILDRRQTREHDQRLFVILDFLHLKTEFSHKECVFGGHLQTK